MTRSTASRLNASGNTRRFRSVIRHSYPGLIDPIRASTGPGEDQLHLFDGLEPGPDIAPLLAASIDERLVTDHWSDVLRRAGSIRTGVTSASAMLARLGSYSRANGMALALRDIKRIERMLFTLN